MQKIFQGCLELNICLNPLDEPKPSLLYFTCLLLLGLRDLGLLPEPGAPLMDTVHNHLLALGWGGMEHLLLFHQLRGAKKEREDLDMVNMGLEPPLPFTSKGSSLNFYSLLRCPPKGKSSLAEDIWPASKSAGGKLMSPHRPQQDTALVAAFRLFFPLDNLISILRCPGL